MDEKKKTNSWTGVIKYRYPSGATDSICIKCYGKSISQAKYKFYEMVRHINASMQLKALVNNGDAFGVSAPQSVLETENATVVARENETSRMPTAK